MWRELGIIEKTAMYHHDSFFDYETADGKVLWLYADIHKLRHELLSWSPADNDLIDEFTESLLDVDRHPKPFPQTGWWNMTVQAIKTIFADMPLILSMVKWQRVSLGEFASRCHYRP